MKDRIKEIKKTDISKKVQIARQVIDEMNTLMMVGDLVRRIIMNGNEKFNYNNQDLDFGMLEFWQTKFSEVYNIQEYIAEFLVERALGINESHNTESWTLFDILYNDYRIEIKQTGYYHPWNKDGKISQVRRFGITKAYSKNKDSNEVLFERQNDIYVFCLNKGETKETSNPLNVNNWEFYVIPTKIINEKCNNYKSIGLEKVRKLTNAIYYDELKGTIDRIIEIDKLL